MNLRKNLFYICGVKFYKHFALSAFLLTGLALSVNAQTTLSQSSSNTITPNNTVTCFNQASQFTRQNSFWRAYDLSTLGSSGTFTVSSVTFGIEVADAGTGTTQPVTINVYSNTGAAFPGGMRTLVGTATTTVADQTLTLLTVNVTTVVPIGAGRQLVLEVNSPDGVVTGNRFFIGSNAAPETAPSYISSTNCNITTPTTYAAIDFPEVHIVLNVTGTVMGTTAASVSIGGRVLSGKRGVSNATIYMTDQNGNMRTSRTNSFGFYRFEDVEVGQTLIFNLFHKRYQFNPQVVSVMEQMSELNFTVD